MLHVTNFQHLASHRHDDFFQPLVSGSCRAKNSICMCHGCGAISSLFLFVVLRVATVEIHGCRASIASAPTTAGLGTGSDGTAECSSRSRACVGRSSDKDYTAGSSAAAGWTTWYSSWTGGGHSCAREAGHVGRQRQGMAQLEFRDEKLTLEPSIRLCRPSSPKKPSREIQNAAKYTREDVRIPENVFDCQSARRVPEESYNDSRNSAASWGIQRREGIEKSGSEEPLQPMP